MGDLQEAVQVFPQKNVDKVEEFTRVRVNGKDLNLTLLMQADELAPLFSGAAWAGTLLWDAAVHLARRFLTDYRPQLQDPTNSLRVIELGAGIGVPGMAARVAGAKHVVLTEQDELLRLMDVNLAANAEVLRLPDGGEGGEEIGSIVARPLSWGVQQTKEYLAQYPSEQVDVVLSCDCIYEPLYGSSWRALAQTMELLCMANPKCVVLMGVERRNQDGIDKFLAFVDTETKLQCRLDEQTIGTNNNRLEVYYLALQ
ncbi:EEF1A lysine methyltransferase 3 [Phytophthora citrophthora]|uniref:EEF1A lysine methyltransferase 3 n=1 Tax=Phytophthora citrophthora TaxID=4793 RepID=A0AAD9G5X1_9STRA|nr:EEF1A lysine methyltransferase 3 [Phytophthora citrophthora]